MGEADLTALLPPEPDLTSLLPPTLGDKVQGYAARVAQGIIGIPAGMARTQAALSEMSPFPTTVMEMVRPGSSRQIAEGLEGFGESLMPANVRPEDQSFAGTLAEGLGSGVGFLIPGGALTKLGMKAGQAFGLLGVGVEAGQAYYEAKAHGASPEGQALAFLGGTLGGATEGLGGLSRVLGRIDKALGGKFLSALVSTSLEEGGQEALQGAIHDAFAQFLHDDPEAHEVFSAKRLEEFAVGGLVGMIFQTGANVLASGTRGTEGLGVDQNLEEVSTPSEAQPIAQPSEPGLGKGSLEQAGAEAVPGSEAPLGPSQPISSAAPAPSIVPERSRIEPGTIPEGLLEAFQERNRGALSRNDLEVREAQPQTPADTWAVEAGRALGLDVRLVEADEALPLPAAYQERTILLDRKAGTEERVRRLLYHEAVHGAQQLTTSWEPAWRLVQELDPKGTAEAEAQYAASWAAQTGSALEPGELTAEGQAHYTELVANYLDEALTNPERLEALTATPEGRTFLQKILDALRQMVARLTGRAMPSLQADLAALKDELARSPLEKSLDPAVAARIALTLRAGIAGLQTLPPIQAQQASAEAVREEAKQPAKRPDPRLPRGRPVQGPARPVEESKPAPTPPVAPAAAPATPASTVQGRPGRSRAVAIADHAASVVARSPSMWRGALERELAEVNQLTPSQAAAVYGAALGRLGPEGKGGSKALIADVGALLSAERLSEEVREDQIRFAVAPGSRDLVALHNLSEENLLHAEELGGLAMPSLYIRKAEHGPIEGFGDITLIGDKGLVDPERGVPVFEADAWTPRHPRVAYRRDDKAAQAIVNELAPHIEGAGMKSWTAFDNLRGENIGFGSGRDSAERAFTGRRTPWRLIYALSQGIGIRSMTKDPLRGVNLPGATTDAFRAFAKSYKGSLHPSMGDADHQALSAAVREAIDAEYAKVPEIDGWRYFDELFDTETGLIFFGRLGRVETAIKAIRSGREPDYDRRSEIAARKTSDEAYREWYTGLLDRIWKDPYIAVGRRKVPYSLDAVIDAMRSQRPEGKEESLTFGAGKARAVSAKRFRSIEEVREAASRLTDDFSAYEKEIQQPLMEAYHAEVLPGYRYENDTWGALDDSMRAIGDVLKRQSVTPGQMRAALVRRGFTRVSGDMIQAGMKLAEAVRGAPSEYFEAKPQESIPLSRFKAAAVPVKAKRAREALERAGVPVVTYAGSEKRAAAVEKATRQAERANPDIRFAVQTDQGASWSAPDDTRRKWIARRLLSEFDRLKTDEDAAGVPEEESAYRRLLLMGDRIAGRFIDQRNRALREVVRPIAKRGGDLPTLDRYSMARHAPDRNRAIMEAFPDEGWGTEFKPGSGMTNSEAAKIIAEVEGGKLGAVYKKAADAVDAMLKENRARMVEAGLITQDTADNWEERFGPHYRPLKTVGEPEMEAFPSKRLTVRGPESKQARGRRSLATDITLQALSQVEETISRAERTQFGQKFGAIARNYPNPEVWEFYDDYAQIPKEDHKAVFAYKENGQEQYVVVRDKLLHDALLRLEVGGSEFIRAVSGAANFFKRLHTTWNVAFTLPNLARDASLAGITLTAEEGAGFAASALAPSRMSANAKAMWRVLRDFDAKGEREDMVRRFIKAGGMTNWVPTQSMERKAKEIAKSFKDEKGILPGLRGLVSLLEDSSSALENATRLSVFETALERGYSEEKAALMGKEVTVNFSRKGTWSSGIGALYLFFNAGMQGTARAGRLFANPKSRRVAAALTTGIFATGFLLSFLNRMMGGDDEDGFNLWDNVQDYQITRTLVVLIPGTDGKQLRVPLPWLFNIPFYAGQKAERIAFGRDDPVQAAGLIGHAMLEAMAPIGGEANFTQNLSFWFTDPIVQLEQNQEWYGGPIMPEPSPFDPAPPPDSARYWPNVNPALRSFTSWMNSATGGSQVEPGAVDVSPETLEHLLAFLTGGAGRTTGRGFDVAQKALQGEPVDLNKLPILNRFVGEPDIRFLRVYMKEAEQRIAYEKKKQKERLPFDRRLLSLEGRLKATEKRIKLAREREDEATEEAARRAFVKAYRAAQGEG